MHKINFPTTSENTPQRMRKNQETYTRESIGIKALKGLGLIALYGSLQIGSAVSQDIATGIQEGRERVAEDYAQLHTIYKRPEIDDVYDSHATIVLTGLGTKDASETAALLASYREIGSVYAIEYGNKDLNTDKMAHLIEKKIASDSIQSISFDGYSMGGPIALDIATKLHENDPSLHIASLALHSSPIGETGLTSASKKSIYALERILALHDDFVYYAKGRKLIELTARSNHFISEIGCDTSVGFEIHNQSEYSFNGTRYTLNHESFKKEIHSIDEKMADPKVAAANLVYNQARVLKHDIASRFKKLPDETVVVYTRARDGAQDTVVDVEVSGRHIAEMLQDNSQPYRVVREAVGHANPGEETEAYNSMIDHHIKPFVKAQLRDLQSETALEQKQSNLANRTHN
jgi:predicted esterase